MTALLEMLLERSGFDFRGYSQSGVRRRLLRCCDLEKVDGLSSLSALASRDPEVLSRVLREISVSATAMFRDPTFFKVLRDQVLPTFAQQPVIRIWHAGCATGEDRTLPLRQAHSAPARAGVRFANEKGESGLKKRRG